jgi:hypothetical protein
MVLLTCFVHPVNTDAHPGIPPGWRWAVMVGPCAPSDVERCANAGWAPSAEQATAEGDQNAATATRALQLVGVHGRYGAPIRLDYDPIPAGADRVHTV